MAGKLTPGRRFVYVIGRKRGDGTLEYAPTAPSYVKAGVGFERTKVFSQHVGALVRANQYNAKDRRLNPSFKPDEVWSAIPCEVLPLLDEGVTKVGEARRMDVIAEIGAERERQLAEEGWTLEHDDLHANGEMALAAGCYALNAAPERFTDGIVPIFWPWAREWWKPRSRRRDLVRAAALIVAEIERIDRASIEKLAQALPREPAR